MEKIVIKSEEEMRVAARIVLKELEKKRDKKGSILRKVEPGQESVVLGLKGELGSGKTVMVRGILREMGVKDRVTSPTFVIAKIYKLKKKVLGFKQVIHIDAYRLNGLEDLKKIGFLGWMRDKNNLILLEWPERVAGISSSFLMKIMFKYGEREGERIVSFRYKL